MEVLGEFKCQEQHHELASRGEDSHLQFRASHGTYVWLSNKL